MLQVLPVIYDDVECVGCEVVSCVYVGVVSAGAMMLVLLEDVVSAATS
jgi:hypothetical protein